MHINNILPVIVAALVLHNIALIVGDWLITTYLLITYVALYEGLGITRLIKPYTNIATKVKRC